MKKIILTCALLAGIITFANAAPVFNREAIFQPQNKHTHGSSIVELPNGDLLSCWFYGSGERSANDVKIMGSRLTNGQTQWSQPFEMADTPNLPDCNPVMFLDGNKLTLVWIIVYNNVWQDSMLSYKSSVDFLGSGAPVWNSENLIAVIQNDGYEKKVETGFKEIRATTGWSPIWCEYALAYDKLVITAAASKEKRNKGWMTRIHPLKTNTGRILLPLYSDGYNLSMTLNSDDNGATWYPSDPIVGLGPIQPSLVQMQNGNIMAYMRTSGENERIYKATSEDNGATWSVATDTEVPNPGSSLELIKLSNGNWLLVCNDTTDERNKLSAWMSHDEGKSWCWKKVIVTSEKGSYSYPSVIQTKDGMIRVTFSCVENGLETIDYAYFNLEWVME